MASEMICVRCSCAARDCCAKCRRAFYCTRACQLADWSYHKTVCQTSPAELIHERIGGNLAIFAAHHGHPVIVHAPGVDMLRRDDPCFVHLSLGNSAQIGGNIAAQHSAVAVYDGGVILPIGPDLQKIKKTTARPPENWSISFWA